MWFVLYLCLYFNLNLFFIIRLHSSCTFVTLWVNNDQHCFHYKCHCLIINLKQIYNIGIIDFPLYEFTISLKLIETFKTIIDITK
jgi:hypothetical protein